MLALLPQPCSYRAAALGAVDKMGRPYQLVITYTSLAGIQNLVGGNLAVSVLTQSSLTEAVQALGPQAGLPALATIDTCLFRNPHSSASLVEPFTTFIRSHFRGKKALRR